MRSFLLDTQPLILELTGQGSKIGRGARRVLDGFGDRSVRLHASTATLIELWNTERAGKMRLREPLGTVIARWQSAGLVIVPVDPVDVLEARGLAWEHQDTWDRIIVATALRLRLPVVTGDRAIRRWSGVESIW